MPQNTIFFLSPYQHPLININHGSVTKSSNSEKILGITIDSDFTFEEHINTKKNILIKSYPKTASVI